MKKDVVSFLKAQSGVKLATVSGVATTNAEMVRFFDAEVPGVDIITTKSYQVTPNAGNPEPVICETQTGCFGNSVGLKNKGMVDMLLSRVEEPVMQDDSPVPLPERTDGVLCLESA